MQKIYCMSCNKSTEYMSSVPKFCSHCGKNYLDGVSANDNNQRQPNHQTKPQNPPNQPRRPIKQEPDEYYDEGLPTEFNIEKLEYEIEGEFRPTRESLQSLGSQQKTGFKRQPQKGKKVSKKEFERQWKEQFDKGTKQSPISLGD